MNVQKQKNFIIKFTYFLIIIGLIFIAMKYVIPLLMPFIIGLIISIILKPTINFVAKRQK